MSDISDSSSSSTTSITSSSGVPSDDEVEMPKQEESQPETTPAPEKEEENAAEPKPAEKPKPRQKRKDDFNIGNVLGQGAFGQVVEVEDKETHKHYAMKVLSKMHIMREKKMNYVTIERDVMTKLNHPNIVKLYLTFQDPGNLFYVVELAQNGDLQHVINEYHSLDVESAKIILGQLLLAIAHMHKKRILHRDLKPENILLDSENRVKLTDFGTAKIFDNAKEFVAERGSFVGSADYVSPETLKETPISASSDLWSYGCIVYSLFCGEGPYHTESSYATFQKIEANDFKVPDYVPAEAKDLIEKLLVLDPAGRLGNGDYDTDYESIRTHPFFKDINWEELPHTVPPKFEQLPAFAENKPKEEEQEKAESQVEASQEVAASATEEVQEFVKKSQMEQFLLSGEKIIYEGDIQKRVFLSTKNRRLVLTDRPRLFYVDLKENIVKGSIPLCKELKVKLQSKTKWNIIVPERTYNLQSDDCDLEKWKTAIEQVVAKL
jgi:3-phosphoinositide dependent protein kinase-1